MCIVENNSNIEKPFRDFLKETISAIDRCTKEIALAIILFALPAAGAVAASVLWGVAIINPLTGFALLITAVMVEMIFIVIHLSQTWDPFSKKEHLFNKISNCLQLLLDFKKLSFKRKFEFFKEYGAYCKKLSFVSLNDKVGIDKKWLEEHLSKTNKISSAFKLQYFQTNFPDIIHFQKLAYIFGLLKDENITVIEIKKDPKIQALAKQEGITVDEIVSLIKACPNLKSLHLHGLDAFPAIKKHVKNISVVDLNCKKTQDNLTALSLLS